MISKQSMSRSKGRWRKSRCSDPWCRSRTGGQSPSSPSALIPSTIPKGISDDVSRYFWMPASGASGSRTGAAARRLHRNIGCLVITSKNCATAVHPSIQQTANAFAVPTIPARPFKPGRTGEVLRLCRPSRPQGLADDPQGGRGFNSFGRGSSATAPTLIRRVFLVPGLLIILPKSKISNLSPANSLDETRPIDRPATAFEHLFSNRPQAIASEKLSRNSGGRGAMTSKGAA